MNIIIIPDSEVYFQFQTQVLQATFTSLAVGALMRTLKVCILFSSNYCDGSTTRPENKTSPDDLSLIM